MTYIFDRGELLVEKVDCTAEKQLLDIAYIGNPAKDGVADTSVPDFIIRLLRKTPKCLSMAGPPEDYKPQRWEYTRVYEIAKCEALSSIDEHTPVDRIVGVYIDLKAFLERIRCIVREPDEGTWFVREWNDLNQKKAL